MHRTSAALAELHLELLYERDEAGLLVRSRDPDVAAPLLHLVRTTEGNRWLLSAALSEQQCAELQQALVSEPLVGDLGEMEASPPVLHGIRSLLSADREQLEEERGPTFLFPNAEPGTRGTADILREAHNVPSVSELAWIQGVTSAEHPLSVARNSFGEVIAVCHSARATADAAEAGVETARDYRGRGLAGAVVLRWAAAVRAGGRTPLYSTEWTNHASRAVARTLGLIPYGEDYRIG